MRDGDALRRDQPFQRPGKAAAAPIGIVPAIMLDMDAAADARQPGGKATIEKRADMMRDHGPGVALAHERSEGRHEQPGLAGRFAKADQLPAEPRKGRPLGNKALARAFERDDHQLGIHPREIEHDSLDPARGHALDDVEMGGHRGAFLESGSGPDQQGPCPALRPGIFRIRNGNHRSARCFLQFRICELGLFAPETGGNPAIGGRMRLAPALLPSIPDRPLWP